jgi:hypothetical protein
MQLKYVMADKAYVGRRLKLKDRMNPENEHTYIYTEKLSDGNVFAQGIVYRGEKSPNIVCLNPSLEVYNNERLYWCSQTSKAIARAMNENGVAVQRGLIFELLHSSPKEVLEYQQWEETQDCEEYEGDWYGDD